MAQHALDEGGAARPARRSILRRAKPALQNGAAMASSEIIGASRSAAALRFPPHDFRWPAICVDVSPVAAQLKRRAEAWR
ncbi:MAG: hypothetical protein ABI629_16080 [bacterium]